jgi:hydroxyacylglutathione hydrolase
MSDLAASLLRVTPFEQNCAVIWDKRSMAGIVLDPGGEAPRIAEAAGKLGVTVERILLTHGHVDHAGGAAELAETLGVEVVGPHVADRFLLDGLPQQGAAYGIEARAVTPDRWLEEGETVAIGGHAFEVRHCPGHTPGHVVFVAEALRAALVGDVLFRGSVGRTDFPYGDPDALLGAIRAKLLPLPDDTTFLCGHGPGSTIGAERRENPFLR